MIHKKWLLTSEGYVKFHYRVYDQSMYCMDTFNDKLELNHKIHLYICFKSGVDIRQYSSWFIPYVIFIFFNCRMYYLITV